MIKVPWNKQSVPHCVLEITGKCNLSCKACYRKKNNVDKSLEKIVEELKIIEYNQKLHTVSLAGGEPTLHPQLCEIIRQIKSRNYKVSLVTNGLALNREMLLRLKTAGLDVIMIHIDEGQERPDLPNRPTIKDVNNLRKKITDKVTSYGIDAGLCVTIYKDTFSNISQLIELILKSPNINYLLATHAVTIPEIIDKTGTNEFFRASSTRNGDIIKLMKEKFGLDPYVYIPSKNHREEKACISYFIPVIYSNAKYTYHKIQSCWIDKMLIKLSRIITGRYLYYCKQKSAIISVLVLINSLAKFNLLKSTRFIFRAMPAKNSMKGKRLVFENTPVINSNGEINCCEFCPNLTVRDKKIVPVCLADHKL